MRYKQEKKSHTFMHFCFPQENHSATNTDGTHLRVANTKERRLRFQ